MIFQIVRFPYIHNHLTTTQIMIRVELATFPGTFAHWYFFGYGTLIQILLAILTAWIVEAIALYLRRYPVIASLRDHSAVLTALLLGSSLPPLVPWWTTVIGTTFSIIIAKQIYGGFGHNLFNPAMIGYAVLLISFPVQMTSWLLPRGLQKETLDLLDTLNVIFIDHTILDNVTQQLQRGIDGISQATPLDTLKTGLNTGYNLDQILIHPIFGGVIACAEWKWINIAYVLGGVFLLVTNTIQWHIPISFLISLTVCSTLGWFFSPSTFASPFLHLFSGATMFGAFFIATDPVTASTTYKGRLFFGMLIGLLVWLIRNFGGYPDGVAFAVLLANICTPLIDYYTQPRVYGHRN